MTDPTTTGPSLEQILADLAALGLHATKLVVAVMDVEQRTTAAAARWLPAEDADDTSLEAATRIGTGIDAADAALARATPRITTLSLSVDRLSRAVRRTVALARRIKQGWPHPYTGAAMSDERRALLLRQAASGARAAIRAHTRGDGEAAERLFAELNVHLDDAEFDDDFYALPVRAMTRILCRKVGVTLKDAPKPERAIAETPRHDSG